LPLLLSVSSVSIRARPGGRAKRTEALKLPRESMFQSAPGREAGRSASFCRDIAGVLLFQSAPGREAGRSGHRVRSAVMAGRFQSAPGREAGRSIAWQSPDHEPSPCFNPRPAGRPGEAAFAPSAATQNRVSIRARPGGRAKRRRDGGARDVAAVSIRARPGGRAKRPRPSPCALG